MGGGPGGGAPRAHLLPFPNRSFPQATLLSPLLTGHGGEPPRCGSTEGPTSFWQGRPCRTGLKGQDQRGVVQGSRWSGSLDPLLQGDLDLPLSSEVAPQQAPCPCGGWGENAVPGRAPGGEASRVSCLHPAAVPALSRSFPTPFPAIRRRFPRFPCHSCTFPRHSHESGNPLSVLTPHSPTATRVLDQEARGT